MQVNPSLSEETTQALSVSQLNQQIKGLLESGVGAVWLKGEISNFKPHSSGHLYFSLKDSQSQIKAVMFRGHNGRLKFKPQDGLEVLVYGQISVYVPRGDYQIYVEHMEPLGSGALQKAFEELKQKLFKEGLFDQARKKSLPRRPRRIAVITSPTGAAVRDILNILQRRVPSIPVLIIPALVQGAQASSDLIRALEEAQKISDLDVIILGRGGGSIEDLWCFNDEGLARAIAACRIPIISAVGHEIDFTIADFVADLRAPTPSAAAELVATPDEELLRDLRRFSQQIMLLFRKKCQSEAQLLKSLSARLVDPKKRLAELLQRRDELVERLENAFRHRVAHLRQHLSLVTHKIISLAVTIKPLQLQLAGLSERLFNGMRHIYESQRHMFFKLIALLDSLSPLSIMRRGFGYQMKLNGHIVKTVEDITVDEEVITFLVNGKFHSKITKILKKEEV